MKKILFIVNSGKISPNENGGASVYYSHLELLFQSGYEITILSVVWNEMYAFNKSDYIEILPFVKSIQSYEIEIKKPKTGFKRLYNAIFNPAKFEYFFMNKKNTNFLDSNVKENKIDLVWCEWRWSAIWACKSNLSLPVLYAHHDWEYKLALLRKKPNLNKRFHTFQKKRVEMSLVKEVKACISGSVTECNEIEKFSNKKALYLPTTYQSITPKLENRSNPVIVHLGGMGTTANRLGLERFLDVCWSNLKNEFPTIQLQVIGNIKRAQPSLLEKLQDTNIQCLDFVADLDKVLHPQDIHIIPWEYNTGTRTRIPVVLNYKQVLVATKASAECYPEISNENSVLCDDLEDMTTQIISLYSDREKLHLLSKKGKSTFEQSFTSKSQFVKLQQFLNSILN
tara:strand:+ start:5439 stop:6629 length:1191 start_codon:yes stop_codon:yes gene_type:complete